MLLNNPPLMICVPEVAGAGAGAGSTVGIAGRSGAFVRTHRPRFSKFWSVFVATNCSDKPPSSMPARPSSKADAWSCSEEPASSPPPQAVKANPLTRAVKSMEGPDLEPAFVCFFELGGIATVSVGSEEFILRFIVYLKIHP